VDGKSVVSIWLLALCLLRENRCYSIIQLLNLKLKIEKPKIMDHVVYLDYKAQELENLASGAKTMLIRGSVGRKLPYGRIEANDTLHFIENNSDSLVKGKAIVQSVFFSGKLSKEESIQLVDSFAHQLMLNSGLKKRFRGKRYLTLITVRDFVSLAPFNIDKSAFGNMDDWLPVEDINRVKKQNVKDEKRRQKPEGLRSNSKIKKIVESEEAEQN
jgi:hypothetical protein